MAVFPWTAILRLTDERFNVIEYSIYWSWAAILVTGLIGVIASLVYFSKIDVK
ncbi:MAG: hypothetical protein ACLFR1_15205 [Spirochaetia bacterium]